MESTMSTPSNGTHLKEKATVAKEAVYDFAGEIKDYTTNRLRAYKDLTSEQAHRANRNVVGYVRANPYKAIGIAAAVGIGAGVLAAMWMHRRDD